MKYIKRECRRKHPPKDFMFRDDRKYIKRPPAEYSNPQWHIIYEFSAESTRGKNRYYKVPN